MIWKDKNAIRVGGRVERVEKVKYKEGGEVW